MIVAVRAVLVALVVLGHVLAKRLLALLAEEGHLGRLRERVGLRLGVALGAVIPLLAARGADGDLGVEDVFAGENDVECVRARDSLPTHHMGGGGEEEEEVGLASFRLSRTRGYRDKIRSRIFSQHRTFVSALFNV